MAAEQQGFPLTRVAALVSGMLAPLLGAELVASARVETYDLALVGTAALAILVASWRLWAAASLGSRLVSAGLVGTVLLGQVVASELGGPGVTAPHWQPLGIAVVLAGAACLLLLLAAPASGAPVRNKHPYAL